MASRLGAEGRWPRIVFHVDMDAFYASIEQRDDPSLRGRPVIVGGLGPRGVVSTASYEARPFGVKSAMPMFRARQLCPNAVFLPPRMEAYAEVSRALMAIFERYSPEVEPLSLDEAFLEMTGTERLFGAPDEAARRLLDEVEQELTLTASVGVATTKFLAKVASDLRKPRGLTVCPPGEEARFLAPLPIERLWGVGPKAADKLHASGLHVIGDVARADPVWLKKRFGESFGAHISLLSRGLDERVVDPARERKSLGAERTLDSDLRGRAEVREHLLPLCDEVARGLRKKGLRASGVRLKLKYADFTLVTRHLSLDEGVLDAASLRRAIETLLDRADLDRPIRLVGLAATSLADDDGPSQASLFDRDPGRDRRERLDRALDVLEEKFGRGAVRRAEGEAPQMATPGRPKVRD